MSRRIRKWVFASDCEGPAVTNDNAAEIARYVIPSHGAQLFSQLSRFDDYTAYVRKRPEYNSGDTLRLLLPFLTAYGFTFDKFSKWVRNNPPTWIDGAKAGVTALHSDDVPYFQLTVSYEPFALAVARGLGIPSDHVYCTEFPSDQYDMSNTEARRLKKIAREIASAPEFPSLTIAGTSRSQSSSIALLEQLIWTEMAHELPCSRAILRDVRALGGNEKVNAIYDAMARTHSPIERLLYIGDSITDVEVLREVKQKGGISICFNGDAHALQSAEYCCWGTGATVASLLAMLFATGGHSAVDEFARSGGNDLGKLKRNARLRQVYGRLSSHQWGVARPDTGSIESLEMLIRTSAEYRTLTRPTVSHQEHR